VCSRGSLRHPIVHRGAEGEKAEGEEEMAPGRPGLRLVAPGDGAAPLIPLQVDAPLARGGGGEGGGTREALGVD
jgi:hypothetical protein